MLKIDIFKLQRVAALKFHRNMGETIKKPARLYPAGYHYL